MYRGFRGIYTGSNGWDDVAEFEMNCRLEEVDACGGLEAWAGYPTEKRKKAEKKKEKGNTTSGVKKQKIELASNSINDRTYNEYATEYVRDEVKKKLEGKTRNGELILDNLNIDNINVFGVGNQISTDYAEALVDTIVETCLKGTDKNYNTLVNDLSTGLGYCDGRFFGRTGINSTLAKSNVNGVHVRMNLVIWNHNKTYINKEKTTVLSKIPLIGSIFTRKTLITPYQSFSHENVHVGQLMRLGIQEYNRLYCTPLGKLQLEDEAWGNQVGMKTSWYDKTMADPQSSYYSKLKTLRDNDVQKIFFTERTTYNSGGTDFYTSDIMGIEQ